MADHSMAGGELLMSHVIALITNLQRQGARFFINRDGETLTIQAPEGVLTPEIQAEIVSCKEEILTRLRSGRITFADVTLVFPNSKAVDSIYLNQTAWGWCPYCRATSWWITPACRRSCAVCSPPT